jgi:hypothetical protein
MSPDSTTTAIAPRRDASAAADPYEPRAAGVRGDLRSALALFSETPIARRILQAGRVLAAPREFAVRRALAAELLRRALPAIHIDRERGFALIAPPPGEASLAHAGFLPRLDGILARCRRELDEIRPDLDAIHGAASGRTRLTIDVLHDELHARAPEFADFMLQDEILLPVVEYFRTVPFLARVALPHSIHVPELAEPAFHQRFHADNDDFRQVKLFVNVADVTPEEGPLCFLPADVSARVLRGLRREKKRVGLRSTFSDAEVFRHCDPSDLVRLVGPAGTAAFVDLSRCLHFGSRVAPGRERVILAAAFLRYHRLHVNRATQFAPRSGLDRLRALVLRHPARHPYGHFCPDPRLALRSTRGGEALAAVATHD